MHFSLEFWKRRNDPNKYDNQKNKQTPWISRIKLTFHMVFQHPTFFYCRWIVVNIEKKWVLPRKVAGFLQRNVAARAIRYFIYPHLFVIYYLYIIHYLFYMP